jgi:hypothetical protein
VNHHRLHHLPAAAEGPCIDLRQSARIDGQEGIESERRRRIESAYRQIHRLRSLSSSGSGDHRCSRGHARIVAYSDGRLSVGSTGGPIGAAALSRLSGSQSMMTTVLAGVRGTGEEGKGGEGAGASDVSMGESG